MVGSLVRSIHLVKGVMATMRGSSGLSRNWQRRFKRTSQLLTTKTLTKLDSMRWFSHRRSPSPPGGTQWYRLWLRAAYSLASLWRTPYALSMGMTQQFFVFLSLVTLTFDLDLRTRARFLYKVMQSAMSIRVYPPACVAMRGGCFRRRLFVCQCVSLSAR